MSPSSHHWTHHHSDPHSPRISKNKVSYNGYYNKAEFYLLHPKTSRRIAKLETDGWHESTSDKRGKLWKIEARVTDAPVEILEGDGFDDWIGMMLQHEGEEMRVSVEGWCSAGIEALKTSAKVQKIPVHASLNIPGLSLFKIDFRNPETRSIGSEMSK